MVSRIVVVAPEVRGTTDRWQQCGDGLRPGFAVGKPRGICLADLRVVDHRPVVDLQEVFTLGRAGHQQCRDDTPGRSGRIHVSFGYLETQRTTSLRACTVGEVPRHLTVRMRKPVDREHAAAGRRPSRTGYGCCACPGQSSVTSLASMMGSSPTMANRRPPGLSRASKRGSYTGMDPVSTMTSKRWPLPVSQRHPPFPPGHCRGRPHAGSGARAAAMSAWISRLCTCPPSRARQAET